MEGLRSRLQHRLPIIGDGGMGSALFERGLDPGDCPESVNLTRLELLEEIARLYREAGAEIIQTNTFGGSPLKLASYGLDGQCEEINARAVQAARKVAGKEAYVVASCGPSGRTLKPYGDTEPGAIRESFARQMTALVAAGIDGICLETMTDLQEARLAIEAAREARGGGEFPIMATMTFDATPRGFFTIMGVDIPAAAAGLAEAGAEVVGSNCGNGIDNMVKIARRFLEVTDLPIIIQSNAGLPVIEDGRAVYPESPAFMAERAREMITAGVSIIGGCCGTTPDHIRALKELIDG